MANVPYIIEFTAGDTLPGLQGAITEDDDVTAIDITGYTITGIIGYPTPLEKVATIVDAAGGVFQFEWLTTDLVAGSYEFRVKIDDGSGGIITLTEEEETDETILFSIKAAL